MKISVIIPNYNGEILLKKNLPSVVKAIERYSTQTSEEFEILVIDDFSGDNSQQLLKDFKEKLGDKFNYVRNEKNYGFSTTVNRGAAIAKGEFLLLLNSDVSPSIDFIDPLIRNFKDEKIFAVGCLDKSIENGNFVSRGRGKGYWRRGFLVHSAASVKKGPTLWVSGGSGMFRKSVWEKLGGLSEIYNPFYWEDIDLSYRALKSGYKTIFEPESVVIHEHEKGAIKSKYSNNQVKKIAYRNQIIFVWHNASLKKLVQNILWLPYHLVNTIARGDFMFTMGLTKALILAPAIFSLRTNAQKTFMLDDDEVVSYAK